MAANFANEFSRVRGFFISLGISMDSGGKQLKPIKRHYVKSRSMISMGYEPRRCELDIEYPSREVYRYFGVPLEEYAAFMAAESKGRYLNTIFKLKDYPYMLIESKKVA
jgi:hypothetical protein